MKRANNSPIVVRNSTHKRFFVSDVHVPDGNIKLLPLTMQRKQCTMFRIEICVCVCVLCATQTKSGHIFGRTIEVGEVDEHQSTLIQFPKAATKQKWNLWKRKENDENC